MKTADPNRALDDFLEQARDGLSRLAELTVALDRTAAKESLRRAVAEDAAFRLGALWEVFQGRWHVCAISRSPQVFVAETKKLLERQVKDEVRSTVLALHPKALTVPPHPTLLQIEAILDPDGFNITFKDSEAWVNSSARYHADKFKSLVKSIVSDPESASLLDLLKRLRNYLAHGSHGSKASFNRACETRPSGQREGLVGPRNDPLKRDQRDVRDVGAYLRASVGGTGDRRIDVLHRRVIEVAEKLRVL